MRMASNMGGLGNPGTTRRTAYERYDCLRITLSIYEGNQVRREDALAGFSVPLQTSPSYNEGDGRPDFHISSDLR